MHLLNNFNECSLVSGGSSHEIGSSETVYFDTLPGFNIIGLDINLISFDVYLDNPYGSHDNEWVLPVYEITPIYSKTQK